MNNSFLTKYIYYSRNLSSNLFGISYTIIMYKDTSVCISVNKQTVPCFFCANFLTASLFKTNCLHKILKTWQHICTYILIGKKGMPVPALACPFVKIFGHCQFANDRSLGGTRQCPRLPTIDVSIMGMPICQDGHLPIALPLGTYGQQKSLKLIKKRKRI